MKRIKKAYKCVFPKLFTESYNSYMWVDDKQFEIIYGANQKEAVNHKCSLDEIYSYWEMKKSIRTRRFPEMDLYRQDKSELLNDLSDKEISHLTHSLGVEIGSVCPHEFYRNYSLYYDKNEECDKLVSIGLMDMNKKLDSYVYSVSRKGIRAVKTLLITTHDYK